MHTNLKAKVYVLTLRDENHYNPGSPSINVMSLENYCFRHDIKPNDFYSDFLEDSEGEALREWFENNKFFKTDNITCLIDLIDGLTDEQCILEWERLDLFRNLIDQLAKWRER